MRLGVSSCLLGTQCRYDGGHAKDKFVIEDLNKYFELLPYCPEEIVFGTPRPTIRLVQTSKGLRVRTTKDEQDLTETLQEICIQNAKELEKEELCGFILKSKSPTCGMERVKLYFEDNPMSEKSGVGLFASQIQQMYPHLPVEEEGRLNDAWLRENFLMQVFAYEDVQKMLKEIKEYKTLVDFHTSYKYLIYAKSHEAYKELGNIVANHEKKSLQEVVQNYHLAFVKAIAIKSSIKKTYNVLLHIYGYFKDLITKDERDEVLEDIEDFKRQVIPLVAVIRVFGLYVKRFDIEYLKNQKFLQPYPKALALRSDVKAYK